jgi:hypothetical protein
LESGETADLESGEPTDLVSDKPTDLVSDKPTELVSDKPTELVSTGINNYINYLCQKKEGYDNLPYCKLYEYWLDLKTSKDKKSLIDSVKVLFTDVSSRLGNGLLPKIINLALESNSPVQYLKTIFLFINNKKFNNDETKKLLLDLTKSGVTISDDDLETVLTSARNKVYQEYENSFVGENKVFDKHSTYVNLDYRGNRLNEDSFFELVKIIKTTDPRNSGKGEIFTVTFVKKDGTTRVMNARLGVKRYLRGGSLPYDPISKGLLPVYDLQKNDYRIINLNTIISAKVGGQDYIAG